MNNIITKISIWAEIDGQMCMVLLPHKAKLTVLRFAASLSEDGRLHVARDEDDVLFEKAPGDKDRPADVIKKTEDADRYTFAKTLEGQIVTMETFKNRGAEALDEALDAAMAEPTR